MLLTNTGAAATCGAAINRAGGAATTRTITTPSTAVTTPPTTVTPQTGTTTRGTTTETTTGTTNGSSTAGAPVTTTPGVVGTVTQSDSSITGPLCVAPRTTVSLPFTTGIEFGAGQTVQLVNAPDATTPTGTATAAGAVGFHLRGMLMEATS